MDAPERERTTKKRRGLPIAVVGICALALGAFVAIALNLNDASTEATTELSSATSSTTTLDPSAGLSPTTTPAPREPVEQVEGASIEFFIEGEEINSVAVLPDGTVAFGLGQEIRVYDLERLDDFPLFLGPLPRSPTPDADPDSLFEPDPGAFLIASLPDNRLASMHTSRPGIQIWDLREPGSEPQVIREDLGPSHTFESNAEGVLAIGTTITGLVDQTVIIDTRQPQQPAAEAGSGRGDDVLAVALLADGSVAFVPRASTSIEIYAPGSQEPLVLTVPRPTGQVFAIEPLNDGRLATADSRGAIRIWDPLDPDAAPTSFVEGAGNMTQLADGRIAVADSQGKISLLDPARPLDEPLSVQASAQHLVALPDGRLLSAIGNEVKVWELDQFEQHSG